MLPPVAGLVLAAGEGRRYGGPKALVEGWLHWAINALREGGCRDVTVVLGAAADQARELVPEGVGIIVIEDWAEGMGSSLRVGLASLGGTGVRAALVSLVDQPGIGGEAVARVLAGHRNEDSLVAAAYDGVRGHPVLLGARHWPGIAASATGDRGARAYLSKNAPPEELRTALARVAQGLTYVESEIAQHLAALPGEQRQQLSERDLEILRLLGEGRSFSEIAGVLGLGYKTVANSATAIKAKLGVARTADLIRLSVEMGIGRHPL